MSNTLVKPNITAPNPFPSSLKNQAPTLELELASDPTLPRPELLPPEEVFLFLTKSLLLYARLKKLSSSTLG